MTINQAIGIAVEHHRAGRLAEAEQMYRQILAQQPENPHALYYLGLIAQRAGRHDVAVDLISRSIAVNPINAAALNDLGNSLQIIGRRAQAMELYRRSIAIDPKQADALSNLGVALRESGKIDESITACRQAIALRPNYAEAWYNLGIALADKIQVESAIAAYRQAIALKPDYADAYNNLAVALDSIARFNESIVACRQALALRPNFPEAWNNLGAALKEIGELDESMKAARQAVAYQPTFAGAHSNLIYAMHFHPGYDLRAIAAEQRIWNRQHAEPLAAEIPIHRNDRSPDRRLKIGYVSPDFRSQAECYFVVPLLRSHDHEKFEIHCYSSVKAPDAITQMIRSAADVWHDVAYLTDGELARQITADAIDILIDLTMHMAHTRLLTFARKPAPIQITWLAYPGGTGLATMDYRVTDRYLDPPGAYDGAFVEAPIHLPEGWVSYDPIDTIAPPAAPPVTTKGFITFGAQNNFCKLNAPVIAQWAKVMRAVPHSRLCLLAPEGEPRQKTAAGFASHGISADRLLFLPFRRRSEYLSTYRDIDIGLDPFPYNGITTTCDALYMGVPVFTLPGSMPAARAGLSVLSSAGLPDFVASSEDDLVQKIAKLAGDVPRLTSLRATLRDRVKASPLMDGKRFAGHLESAYRQAWRKWCNSTQS
jgi:predicted O-linked N-acetylglucosamine transferase (SPINDLY family)